MSKLEAFAIQGLELWFNSNNHGPPHFHAKRPGEWEIRVRFLSCTDNELDYEIKWKKRGNVPKAKDRSRLLSEVLKNRVSLLEEWERKVD